MTESDTGKEEKPGIPIISQDEAEQGLAKIDRKRELAKIESIRAELQNAGAPKEITTRLEGYKEKDVPVVYSGEPHDVFYGGGDNEGKDHGRPTKSHLLVGMKAPIYESPSKYWDQNPNVIVQWRGLEFTDEKGGRKGITREEVEEVKSGVYVRRVYKNVSAMGEFDGELAQIELQVESGEFPPNSNYPGRKKYRPLTFLRNKDDSWSPFGLNVTSTTILNGAQELRAFHLSEIRTVKDALPSEVKELPAPPNAVEETERLEKKLKELVEKHPETVKRIRDNLERMYELSVSQLENPKLLKNAIEMLIDGIFSYPERVFIAGRLISAFSNRSKFMLAQVLSRDGQEDFVEWYNKKGVSGLFTGDSLRDRIIDKNLYHFVQFWDIHTKEEFNDPDWRQLEESLIHLQNGINRGHYPLLVKLFDGLQASALECFIEDNVIEKVMGKEVKNQPLALPPIIQKRK